MDRGSGQCADLDEVLGASDHAPTRPTLGWDAGRAQLDGRGSLGPPPSVLPPDELSSDIMLRWE